MTNFGGISLGIACAYVLYRASATFIRTYLITKLTALDELSQIGVKSTRTSEKLRGSAVICGGSISGLLAAKVCSDHFEDVIIIESEEWITSPDGYTGSHREGPASKKRSHVAQYRAIHLFQPFLAEALMKWFPSLKEECEKLGGKIVSNYWPLTYSGLPFAEPSFSKADFRTIKLNRPGFETLVRRLVMTSCKNVQYLAGNALGLIQHSSDGNFVSGVRVRSLNQEELRLPAVLVIDCTGPSSAGLRWLKELAETTGNGTAVEKLNNLRTTYDPKQSYYTCEFDVPLELIPHLTEINVPVDWDTTGVIWSIFPDAKLDNKIFGVTRKDSNYMEIFCGGWAITEVISNIDDIRLFLSNLKTYKQLPTWIFQMLDLFEEHHVPLTIDHTRMGPSTYIPYNKYEDMPSNFIAIGDSVLKSNPVMGVGCTRACIEVLTLNTLLNKCHPANQAAKDLLPSDFSRKFHKLQARRTTESDWDNNRLQDYAWATTVPAKGDNPKTFKIFQKAIGQWILNTSIKDAEFASRIRNIRGFLLPPTDLFAPSAVLRILKANLFQNRLF